MATVASVVDSLAPDIWRIARRGFVCQDGEDRVIIRGIDNADVVEKLIVGIIATLCTPQARPDFQSLEALQKAALKRARERLIAYAKRSGREVSLKGEDAEGHDDLDAIIAGDAKLSDADPPPDVEAENRAEAGMKIVREYVHSLDYKTAQLISLRWLQGKNNKECAKVLDCGRAAVREWVRRTRREVRHMLLRAKAGDGFGPATLDLLLAQDPLGTRPPPIVVQRMCREVCTRTFQKPEPPFAQRAVWGVGISAIAATAWLLMFFGVLPYYGDDFRPKPAITCNPSCSPGTEVKISVLAPKDATHVAIVTRDEKGTVHRLLTAPSGGSIRLPMGSRQKLIPIPYSTKIPNSSSGWAMAVFSDGALASREVMKAVGGDLSHRGAQTATVALR